MTSILFPVFRFLDRNKWAQYVLLFVTGFIVVKLWGDSRQSYGRKLERQDNAKRQAETRAAMIERKTEIVQEERTLADEALVARDGAEPAVDYDGLRPDQRALAEGRYRSGG